MNYSKQRELIYQALKHSGVHPTAEYIYSVLKDEGAGIALGTIYRNLDKMVKAGRIKKIDGLTQSVHYDHNVSKHYHFICDICGRVFDVTSDIAPDLMRKAQIETGFKINSHDVTFHGFCNDCRLLDN